MKKLILILTVALTSFSCSKSDSPVAGGFTISNTPMAKVAFDNSNFGIYKGVFVGSTGIVLIDINNSSSISATLIIDGISYKYTTTDSATAGTEIQNLTFSNGNSYFQFSVRADGSFPAAYNFNIENHPSANIDIVKEQSDHLVRCFQGTYTGSSSGVFNLIVSESGFEGLSKDNTAESSNTLYGTIANNTISGGNNDVTIVGTININTIKGTWQSNTISDSGTWTGTRKL